MEKGLGLQPGGSGELRYRFEAKDGMFKAATVRLKWTNCGEAKFESSVDDGENWTLIAENEPASYKHFQLNGVEGKSSFLLRVTGSSNLAETSRFLRELRVMGEIAE